MAENEKKPENYLFLLRDAIGPAPEFGQIGRFRLLLAARLPDFLAALAEEARQQPTTEKPGAQPARATFEPTKGQ